MNFTEILLQIYTIIPQLPNEKCSKNVAKNGVEIKQKIISS